MTCAAVALGVGGPAEAASPRIQFHVDPQPYSEALLDIAQQANVTLIGAGACTGASREGLRGALTLEEALTQLLAAAPCDWKMIAPGAVQITPLARVEAAKPAAPATVSELLVTATKRVRDPRGLAVAITAVPRAQLQATGANDTGEAAGQVAGVLATNLGPGRNKLLLRGLSDGVYTGRARSTVATYFDDIPINYNAPDPDLRLVDVERVEVARGPQGALYGAGSLSGIYRIVSRKPDLEQLSAEVRTSGAPSYSVEGYVNYPVWRGMAGVRLSGYDEVQGGYLDDIGQGRSNVDRTVRRGARLLLLLQPNDEWSANITLAGQHLRSDDTHYTTPGMGLKRNVRIPEPHVNDIELATATLKHAWGWGELTSSTGYVRHDYGSLYDATATQFTYTSFAKTSAYSERNRTRMLVEDLFIASRGSGPLEWLAGVYGSDTKSHSPTEFLAQVPRAPNVPVYADALVYGDDRRDRIREIAAYGELSYAFAPNWKAAIGGRVFNIHERTRSDVVAERFPPRSLDRTNDSSGFSPKVSLQYQLASGDLVYAVISEGYRVGGINSGGAQPLPRSRETFAPDRLTNYELGLKLEAMDRRLSLNSAVFYDTWKNIQTDQFRDSGIPYTTNAGDAHILGLETELAYRADNGLSAQLSGRLSHARTLHSNPDLAPRLANGLPGAPSISAGAVLGYEREVLGDWTLRLTGQATYVGKSRVAFESTLTEMGGYARTKLSAELSRRNLGVQVYVLNPLNAYSDTFAFGNPFNPAPQIRQITPQRPITVGITLSAAL